MKIKKASKKDINIILKFQTLLHKYESQFYNLKFNKQKIRKNTLNALSEKDTAYFIAYSGNKPVGCSEVYLKGNSAIMSGTYVLSKFRRRGFGRALFDARRKWAKKFGAKKLRLEVYKGNVKAINAWKRLGYNVVNRKGKSVVMEQHLGQ